MRVALVIEYDGADYHGFQYQLNAPSIQGEQETAIKCMTGAGVRIKGAGGTDAGVHALAQVANFEEILTLSRQGTINPLVGREFPLAEYAAALRCLSERQAIGKVVVTLR